MPRLSIPSDPLHGQAWRGAPAAYDAPSSSVISAIDRVLITALEFAHGPVVIFLKHGQRLRLL